MLMLLFYVADQAYAIASQHIFEVVPYIHLEKNISSLGYVKGLANFEGRPVSVVDFSQLMSGKPSAFYLHTRIIFLCESNRESRRSSLGIIAEKVIEVMEIPPSDFHEPEFNINDLPFLSGLANERGRSIQRIDVDKLFEFLQASVNDSRS